MKDTPAKKRHDEDDEDEYDRDGASSASKLSAGGRKLSSRRI
jgi:hypothetical protein